MKKILYLVLISLVVFSCERPKPSHLNYKSVKLENSLLWQISGNGLKSPSYLFGTDHLIGANFLDSLPDVMDKFKRCKAVVCEVVLDTNAGKLSREWFLKDDLLSKEFTPKEFTKIDSLLGRYSKVRLMQLNGLKPIYVALFLSVSMTPKTSSPENPGLDKYFQQKGIERGIKVLGLETEKFQQNTLADIPIDIQKKELRFLINNIDFLKKSKKDNFNFYRHQDLNKMDKLILSYSDTPPEVMDQFIKDRNTKWVRDLPAIMMDQPTFIAVGAGHLLWDCGLVNQLRLKGYFVTPITN